MKNYVKMPSILVNTVPYVLSELKQLRMKTNAYHSGLEFQRRIVGIVISFALIMWEIPANVYLLAIIT